MTVENLQPGYLFYKEDDFKFEDCYMIVGYPEYGHVQSTLGGFSKKWGSLQHDGRLKENYAYFAYCSGKFVSRRALEGFDGWNVKKTINSKETFVFYA